MSTNSGSGGETSAAEAQESPARSAAYETYAVWKGWGSRETDGDFDEMFETEMARLGVKAGDAVLDVGFGNGTFLDWASQRGYSVAGIEINRQFVEFAQSREHRAYHGTVQDFAASAQEAFAGIVFFDVVEHLSVEDAVSALTAACSLLAPGGRILVRVPNGGSPFGLLYFNGDVTHRLALTPESMVQIATMAGLRVLFAGNAARITRYSGSIKKMILRKIRNFLRDLFERVIGLTYFSKRVPMDPNLTFVLEPAAASVKSGT